MTVLQAALHLVLLGVVARTTVGLLMLRRRSQGDDTEPGRAAVWVWRWLPATPLLGLTCVLWQRPGFDLDVAFAAGAWLMLWLGARMLFGPAPAVALAMRPGTGAQRDPTGLLTYLALAAMHLVLLTACSRSTPPPRTWLTETAWCWVAVAVIAGALQHPGMLRLLSGRSATLIRLALLGAFAMALVGVVLHRTLPVHVLLLVAFLVGGSLHIARIDGCATRHSTVAGWCRRWSPALLLCGLAVATPVLLTRGDFSPAVIVAVSFVLVLVRYRESVAAAALGGAMSAGLALVWWSGLVAKLNDRVAALSTPGDAGDAQLIHSLWAVCRGGLFGTGHLEAWTSGGRSVRPAVILAPTDGVAVVCAEVLGVVGAVCLMVQLGLMCSWLLGGVRTASPRRRAFCDLAALIIAVTSLWAFGWSVGLLPIAGVSLPYIARGEAVQLLWGAVTATALAFGSEQTDDVFAGDASPSVRSLPQLALGLAAAATVVRLCLLATALRAGTLARLYYDRHGQARAAYAIARGLVKAADGKLFVSNQAIPLPEHGLPRAKQARAWAQRAIVRGDFEAGLDGPRLVRSSFVQSEPSGLGRALRDAALTRDARPKEGGRP